MTNDSIKVFEGLPMTGFRRLCVRDSSNHDNRTLIYFLYQHILTFNAIIGTAFDSRHIQSRLLENYCLFE